MTPAQLDLFPHAPSRGFSARRDSTVQRDAARQVRVGPGERVVLFALWHGPSTVDGIAERTDGYAPSLDRRCKALRERGLVESTGRTAPTRRARQAVVWTLTEQGRGVVRRLRESA